MTYQNRKSLLRGYVALISTLIISAVLMTAVFTASSSAFLSQQNSFSVEKYMEARQLANACASIALLYLSEDSTYRPKTTGDSITVWNDSNCKIESVTFNGTTATIKSSAYSSSNYAFIEVIATIDASSNTAIVITSWKEIKDIGI